MNSRVRIGARQDIKALSLVTMELMQGYTKDDGAVGIDDLGRWPSDSRAVDFLSVTTSVNEIARLGKVREGCGCSCYFWISVNSS